MVTYLNAAKNVPDQRFQRIVQALNEHGVYRSEAILRDYAKSKKVSEHLLQLCHAARALTRNVSV